MKKTIVLLAMLALGLTSCSSEMDVVSTDLPPAVNAAFKAKYPNAKDVEWEVQKKDDNLVYEVEFEIDGRDKETKFRADGTEIGD